MNLGGMMICNFSLDKDRKMYPFSHSKRIILVSMRAR
jgi:hypothetical protein